MGRNQTRAAKLRKIVKGLIGHNKKFEFHLENRKESGRHQGGGSMQSNDRK